MMQRLQKLLSDRGVASRRRAEELIREGRVTVNGRIAGLGESADADTDQVTVDGIPIPAAAGYIYLMLNKPRGYVTTLSDEKGRPTAAQLVAGCGRRVYPVGRLDMDSEGLLLLTDDGPLGHELLSPKKHVDKVYRARIEGQVTAEDAALFAKGLEIDDEDGAWRAMPAKLNILSSGPESEVEITIREGKFHQIKRMFEAVDKKVVYLKRLSMGSLRLDETLALGEYRELTEDEVQALKESKGHTNDEE